MHTKRLTIYFDPAIRKVLKLKALETGRSISDIVNEALRHELAPRPRRPCCIYAKSKRTYNILRGAIKEIKGRWENIMY